MKRALIAWRDDCQTRHAGHRVYTSDSGRFWTDFLRAVAARGPFENSNDEKLRELAHQERTALRAKWVRDQRRRREAARKDRRDLHKPPTKQFIREAIGERDRRKAILEARAGDRSLPASISKILPQDAAKTAAITADAWLGEVILKAMGRSANPGAIATFLGKSGRNSGLPYATLRVRLRTDLLRVRLLERGVAGEPIWPPFDPDCDLDGLFDKAVASAPSGTKSEIEEILETLI